MKRVISTGFAAILCLCLCSFLFAAPKKTIHVTPDNAVIYIDGAEVGTGTYTVKFDRGSDFVMVKLAAPGYITKTYKLSKDNPKKTILYKLREDEALAASMNSGEDDGTDIANKWFEVKCRKGLSEDLIWKRLMNIAVNNFEDVEVRDKAAGWLKTRWRTTFFEEQAVRTRMEVRMTFTDEDCVSYRVRIESQKKEDKDCKGPKCWEKFDYILNKYAPLISELQTSVGGGE